MALVADDPTDRAEQLLLLTEQLTALIARDTDAMRRFEPPAGHEETARLANLYRQEMARIGVQQELIRAAPRPLLDKLRTATGLFHDALGAHAAALGAAKEVTEGIVRTIADEITKARESMQGYGAGGAYAAATGAGKALTTNTTA